MAEVRRRAIRGWGVAAGAAVILSSLISAAPASAGEWMRAICQNPNGTPAPIDGLMFSGFNLGQYGGASGGDACPGGLTGLPSLAEVGVWATVTADANTPTQATWTYGAPAGSTIAGGSLTGVNIEQTTYGAALNDMDAWISSPGDDASQADLVADCATPSASSTGGLPGSNRCAENPAAQVLSPIAPAAPLVATIDHSGGTALYMTAGCSTADTDPCNYNAASYANLSFSARFAWADVLLSDDTPPTAAGFGGSLLASGSAHGTADLTFIAQDAGPGVYAVTVKLDGKAIYQATPNSNAGRCVPVGTDPSTGAWIFDYQQPCPTTVTLDVPVDTTQLSDGEHQVVVIEQSADQSSATVLDQLISTDNLTRTAGDGHEGLAPAPAPPAAPAPATSYALRLDPASQKLVGAVLHRRYQQSQISLSGTVINATGDPVPGVSVTVTSSLMAGGGSTPVANATTDGTGHFVIEVPRGDSRQLQLTAGTATVSLGELVSPDLSLRVRSLSGARLSFTGQIAINRAAGPPPSVEIQDHFAGTWQDIATATPTNNGRFEVRYRAARLLIGYAFSIRALTHATALWQAAATPAIKATVRG